MVIQNWWLMSATVSPLAPTNVPEMPEIAGVRLALSDVVTGNELGDQMDKLTESIERLADRLDRIERQLPPADASTEP